MSRHSHEAKIHHAPSETVISLQPGALLRHLWSINPFLTGVALLHLVVLAVAIIGIILDPRLITGMPAWVKPAKFAISFTIYGLTFVWLTGFVKRAPRLAGIAANITAAGILVETAIIALQAGRGTTSHFNNSTPLDETLFGIMGFFVVLIWLMNLVVAIILVWEVLPEPALAMGLRMGLWLTLIGASVGVLMLLPTEDQLARLRAGENVEFVGAHSVGALDGGPGLPFLGWNRYAGDFRPAHFLGLHALQITPLFGWLVSRRRGVSKRLQRRLVFLFGMSYFSLILVLLLQALRGQSVVSPDAITLAILGVLVAILAFTILINGPEKKKSM